MADDAFWIELEYKALRDEMLSQAAAKEAAVRFYLPAAASVYGVPYVPKQTNDEFLWAVCAGVAGLLLLAFVRSLFVSTAAIRRIGAYIKECIEPRTSGGMSWQRIVYSLDDTASYLGHSFTIAGIAIFANVAAAIAIDTLFVKQRVPGWVTLAALAPAALATPNLWLMVSPNGLRRRYSHSVRAILQKERPSSMASVPSSHDAESEAG